MGYYDEAEGIKPRPVTHSFGWWVATVSDFISQACMAICALTLAVTIPMAVIGYLFGWWNPLAALFGGLGVCFGFGMPGTLATFVWSGTMHHQRE